MSSFLLALLVVAFAGQSFAVTFIPPHKLIAVKEELKIVCDVPDTTVHGAEVLSLKIDERKTLTLKSDAVMTEDEPDGFSLKKVLRKPETGVVLNNVTVTIVPTVTGKLVVKCIDKPETLYIVKVTSEVTENKITAEFEIPKAIDLPELKDKLFVKIISPTGTTQDLTTDVKREPCASDENVMRVCYTLTMKEKVTTAAGRYKVELMSTNKENKDVTVATSEAVRTSTTLEIKGCQASTGSNCIADSEHCIFKCNIVGYPYSECAVTGLPESFKDRMVVECVDQGMKITLKKPTQDDTGTYNVTAKGAVPEVTASGELPIRVKDKLAPLWPFLGICAEVVILCAIILFFEKRHQKKLLQQEQEEAGASEPMVKSTGKGGGEVRQRAPKA